MGPNDLPSMLDMFHTLERNEPVLGVFLIGAGLVFMMLGTRIFNVIVVFSFGFVGYLIGRSMPVSESMQWVCALAGAAGLATASTFAVKLSVAVLAGGWSGYLATALALRLGLADPLALAAGGVALILAVSLVFTMYKQIIAFLTSLEGSLLFLGGGIVLLSHVPSLWNELRSLLIENSLFFPFLVLAGTTTGFYLQLADQRQKQAGASG